MDAKREAASYVSARTLAQIREPAPWHETKDPFFAHMEKAQAHLDRAKALVGAKLALKYVQEAEARRDRYVFEEPQKQQRVRARRR